MWSVVDMAVWYDVIDSIKTFLKARAGFTNITVEAGALDPDDYNSALTNGLIFIARDREITENIHRGGEGVIELMLFCWVRSNDADPAKGYDKLSDLEDLLTSGLTAWAYQDNPVTGAVIMNLTIEETIGDLESHRPVFGSRKTVKITWDKRTI